MSSSFTLTIDWLAFTLPITSARETMQVLGGAWTRREGRFRRYSVSWNTQGAGRGIGKLGTGALRDPRVVHVDLSAGIIAPWPHDKVQTILHWVLNKERHLTRNDCAFDDRASCVPLPTIRQAIGGGQCVTHGLSGCSESAPDRFIRGHRPEIRSISAILRVNPLLRIYDKRLELHAKARADWQEYGIRREFELENNRTQLCGQALTALEAGRSVSTKLHNHRFGLRRPGLNGRPAVYELYQIQLQTT